MGMNVGFRQEDARTSEPEAKAKVDGATGQDQAWFERLIKPRFGGAYGPNAHGEGMAWVNLGASGRERTFLEERLTDKLGDERGRGAAGRMAEVMDALNPNQRDPQFQEFRAKALAASRNAAMDGMKDVHRARIESDRQLKNYFESEARAHVWQAERTLCGKIGASDTSQAPEAVVSAKARAATLQVDAMLADSVVGPKLNKIREHYIETQKARAVARMEEPKVPFEDLGSQYDAEFKMRVQLALLDNATVEKVGDNGIAGATRRSIENAGAMEPDRDLRPGQGGFDAERVMLFLKAGRLEDDGPRAVNTDDLRDALNSVRKRMEEGGIPTYAQARLQVAHVDETQRQNRLPMEGQRAAESDLGRMLEGCSTLAGNQREAQKAANDLAGCDMDRATGRAKFHRIYAKESPVYYGLFLANKVADLRTYAGMAWNSGPIFKTRVMTQTATNAVGAAWGVGSTAVSGAWNVGTNAVDTGMNVGQGLVQALLAASQAHHEAGEGDLLAAGGQVFQAGAGAGNAVVSSVRGAGSAVGGATDAVLGTKDAAIEGKNKVVGAVDEVREKREAYVQGNHSAGDAILEDAKVRQEYNMAGVRALYEYADVCKKMLVCAQEEVGGNPHERALAQKNMEALRRQRDIAWDEMALKYPWCIDYMEANEALNPKSLDCRIDDIRTLGDMNAAKGPNPFKDSGIELQNSHGDFEPSIDLGGWTGTPIPEARIEDASEEGVQSAAKKLADRGFVGLDGAPIQAAVAPNASAGATGAEPPPENTRVSVACSKGKLHFVLVEPPKDGGNGYERAGWVDNPEYPGQPSAIGWSDFLMLHEGGNALPPEKVRDTYAKAPRGSREHQAYSLYMALAPGMNDDQMGALVELAKANRRLNGDLSAMSADNPEHVRLVENINTRLRRNAPVSGRIGEDIPAGVVVSAEAYARDCVGHIDEAQKRIGRWSSAELQVFLRDLTITANQAVARDLNLKRGFEAAQAGMDGSGGQSAAVSSPRSAAPRAPAPPPPSPALTTTSSSGPRTERGREGVLLEHGRANYRFDTRENESYFVKLRSGSGEEQTIWGVDLNRAIAESGVAIGESISLRNLGAQPVMVDAPVRDENGQVTGMQKLETHRNAWEVKRNEKVVESE